MAYLLSSLATLANMYFVLTTLYPNNPRIEDWLGIGQTLGSYPVVALAALIQAGVFLFALTELRAGATRRLARDFATGADEPHSEAVWPMWRSGGPRPRGRRAATATPAARWRSRSADRPSRPSM